MQKISPTLDQLSDSRQMELIFQQTVHEIFGKKGSPTANLELPHGVTDRTWWAGEHFAQLSRELAAKIERTVEGMVEGKVNKFSRTNTKLSENLVSMEEIWLVISKWFGEKLEQQSRKETGEIPGLERGVNEGVIRLAGGKKKVPDVTLEEREDARKEFKKKLPKVDDQFIFLTKVRENFYQYFKSKYGIFNESEQETSLGRK